MAEQDTKRDPKGTSERILVAGSRGFIGSTLTQALWKAEREVAVLSRHPYRTRTHLRGIEIDYVKADLRKPKTLPKALKGVSTVVSCVQFQGHPGEKAAAGRSFESLHVEGIANLLTASREAGVRHFIYVSAAGVGSPRPGLDGRPWYRAKELAEQAVISSGIPYTIFRPAWVYGRDDSSLNKLIGCAETLPFVPVIGDGNNRVQPLFIMDFVKVLAAATKLDTGTNQVYELGGPENLSINAIVDTIFEVMGRRKRVVHQPKWFAKAVSMPLQLLRRPPLSIDAIELATTDERIDNTRTLRDFAPTLTPLREALETYLNPAAQSLS